MNKKIDEQIIAERLADLTDKLLSGIELQKEEQKEMHDLMSIIENIQSSSENTGPSPEFAQKLRKMVLNKLPSKKSELSERVQKVLAKILGEEDFRRDFFSAPEKTLLNAGFQLSPAEIAALKEMTAEDQQKWSSELDERISKSGLPGMDL